MQDQNQRKFCFIGLFYFQDMESKFYKLTRFFFKWTFFYLIFLKNIMLIEN